MHNEIVFEIQFFLDFVDAYFVSFNQFLNLSINTMLDFNSWGQDQKSASNIHNHVHRYLHGNLWVISETEKITSIWKQPSLQGFSLIARCHKLTHLTLSLSLSLAWTYHFIAVELRKLNDGLHIMFYFLTHPQTGEKGWVIASFFQPIV